jgi:hypothetical protein
MIRSAAFSAIMIVAADKIRHHRGIDDAQPFDSEHTKFGIDDGR